MWSPGTFKVGREAWKECGPMPSLRGGLGSPTRALKMEGQPGPSKEGRLRAEQTTVPAVTSSPGRTLPRSVPWLLQKDPFWTSDLRTVS